MGLKKVVLLGNRDVLGDAVETFLTTRHQWEVVRIMEDESPEAFIGQIENEQPDVVIVYKTDQATATPWSYQLLQTHPEIKVITLSLENNFLEVYDKHRVWVNQVSDLYSAIDG